MEIGQKFTGEKSDISLKKKNAYFLRTLPQDSEGILKGLTQITVCPGSLKVKEQVRGHLRPVGARPLLSRGTAAQPTQGPIRNAGVCPDVKYQRKGLSSLWAREVGAAHSFVSFPVQRLALPTPS